VDPVIALQERLGLQGNGVSQSCTLQALLDQAGEIETVAGQIRERAARTETMVQKCRQLSPSAAAQIPLGF
jgi:hypothetical protein